MPSSALLSASDAITGWSMGARSTCSMRRAEAAPLLMRKNVLETPSVAV